MLYKYFLISSILVDERQTVVTTSATHPSALSFRLAAQGGKMSEEGCRPIVFSTKKNDQESITKGIDKESNHEVESIMALLSIKSYSFP